MREYYIMRGYDLSEIGEDVYRHNLRREQKEVQETQNTAYHGREQQDLNGQSANRQSADGQNANRRGMNEQSANRQSINEPSVNQRNGNYQPAEIIAEGAQNRHKNWESELMEQTKAKEVDESRYPVYKEHSVLEIAGTALQCLVSISAKKYYNDTILIRTLCGSSDKRILQDKLNFILEYGELSCLDRSAVRITVKWLIEKHYILETKGTHSVLHITNEGLYYKDHMIPKNMKSLAERLNGTKGHSCLSKIDSIHK